MELVLVLVLVVVVGLVVIAATRRSGQRANSEQLADAKADARQAIERLGGQVYMLVGSNDAAKQALADASERLNAAGSQIDQAQTVTQARIAKQTALEGLYYIRAARIAMNMDPGPEIPTLAGQQSAGRVSEDRKIDFEGRQVAASPNPSAQTPNYFPGGRVAGRPVPAGWYSEPWWRPALIGGAWGVGSMLLFSSLFSGMSGVGYDENAFANGYGDGYQDGFDAANADQSADFADSQGDWAGPDGGDPSGGDPSGGDPSGGDPSGGDPSGGDWSGGDWGGFDGGGFDGGGFDGGF
ncbi:DUF1542 domain-containing protein [Skermania sp. ID1734]|uniref:DUF1542 domain-containing protein n=1 Tax=Skermania sp. ID1734 TaxID=2597516 RepID=UPI00117F26B9|nr:DUF1542 domain-containing protein [Skermania sp. ID1734]TSD99999.1 DUF1542 domain-containing protein [Skermania sp. ID1734]